MSPHFAAVVIFIADIQLARFRRFCQRYWGKGLDGRLEIYKTDTALIPHLDDDDMADQDRSDRMNCEPETSAAGSTTATNYKYISFSSDFPNFFGNGRSEILVREEYPTLMSILKNVQAGNGQAPPRYGAVVTGRPGIGQEPRRLYVHFLTSLCRKNVIYPLCTHRKNP